MSNNFPPGVTGNEYAIAGPDYSNESDIPCSKCGGETLEQGFKGDRWLTCLVHNHITDLDPPDPGDNPDRKYNEERDQKMLGIDTPDEVTE